MKEKQIEDTRSDQLTFRQVRSLAERGAVVHRDVARALDRRVPDAENEDQRLMLLTLEDSEQALADALEESFDSSDGPAEDEPRASDAWVQNPPASLLRDAEGLVAELDGLPVARIEDRVHAIGDKLTEFFAQLARAAGDPSQRELLESLAVLESSVDRRHADAAREGLAGRREPS